MFMFEGCPHCKKARGFIEELIKSNPDYSKVPLTLIDEKLSPEIAEKYDYYYVPSFFVDNVKLHEGTPTKEAVENVFKAALAE